MAPARAERAPGRRPEDAVGVESLAGLEAAQAAVVAGPAEPVDRAAVDALRAQRDLQRGHARTGSGSGRGCE